MKKLLFFSILSSVLVLGACNENKKTAEGEEAPKQEVNNLEDIMTFEELTKNKPTLEWKQRMDEDDDLFTEENINATNEVLDSYINSLKELNEQMGFSSKIWLLRQPFSFGANWQVSLTRSWKFFKI